MFEFDEEYAAVVAAADAEVFAPETLPLDPLPRPVTRVEIAAGFAPRHQVGLDFGEALACLSVRREP